MKFTINSKTLLSRVGAAKIAIANKSHIAILSTFLLELKGSELTITASNEESCVVSRVGVEDAEGEGAVCIESKRLTELLKAMADRPISFEVTKDSTEVVIRYPNGKYKLAGLHADNYPINKHNDLNEVVASFEVPAALVLASFEKVGYAICTDDFRPTMQGIFWDITPESLTFVATDTHQLAKYEASNVKAGINTDFILPGRSLPLVKAFIAKEKNIRISATTNSIVFEGEDFMVRTQRLNGRFPDYKRVIPSKMDITIVADRTALLNAVNRVSLCTEVSMPFLCLTFDKDSVCIGAEDRNYNIAGEESIPCCYKGGRFVIGFNSQILKDSLSSFNSSEVVIGLNSPTAPAILKPGEEDENGHLTMLCMPVTIMNS